MNTKNLFVDWAERIMIPYTKLLRHGTVVHAEVTEVGPKGVVVNGRENPISFDYLVLATGSSYAFPGKQKSSMFIYFSALLILSILKNR